jgi:diguanylate cyclase (GGDEF)-like protein
MSAAEALESLQSDALAKLRSGEHSDLLVAFLTTSIMLELSKLVDPNLDLDRFATAAVEVLTQFAPIEQIALAVQLADLPDVHAEIGLPESSADSPIPGGTLSAIELDEGGTGFLDAHGVPASLQRAGLVEQAAGHLTQGLGRMVEFERLRRSAAAGRAFAAIASIDENWSDQDLTNVVSAFAALPGARAAGISVSAARLGGPIAVVAGSTGGIRIERAMLIDERTPVDAWVQLSSNHTAEQLAKVDELVDAFMAAMERAEESIRLREEAELDELTRLGNRRVASRSLAVARNLAERTGESIAVLVCDLDNFKRVNDTFGHGVGDAVLVAFANMAASTVRAFDTVARWGGEEFVVICPNCDEKGAAALADRLLAATPDACSTVLPESHRQTVSIGIASYPRHAVNPEALVRAADQALYAAKHGGRNTHRTAPYPQ